MHQVAILTSDNISMFELSYAIELFALPRPEFDTWYQTKVVSFTEGPLQVTAGLTLSVEMIDNLDAFDTLLIPSWTTAVFTLAPKLKQEIIKLYQRGGRILSFCSGAFLLAEVGLLQQRQSTTHWRYADSFKQRYPTSQFIDNVLYIYHDRIGCSAGSAAAIDLGLEVIRQDFGHHIANQVARRLVVSPHRSGGQSQFVQTPMIENHSQFASTLDWAISQIAQPLTVNALANKAAMSRRSFDRHFRNALGMSAKEWINRQRTKLAQNYLETSTLGLEQIAELSGFTNPLNMRNNFRQYLSISPSQYRSQFGGNHH